MLALGYPTEQQMQRKKPERAALSHIVNENRYLDYDVEQLKAAYGDKAARGAGTQPFDEFMRAFCARKHNSDFSREMSRSVARWIAHYDALE